MKIYQVYLWSWLLLFHEKIPITRPAEIFIYTIKNILVSIYDFLNKFLEFDYPEDYNPGLATPPFQRTVFFYPIPDCVNYEFQTCGLPLLSSFNLIPKH